MDDELKINKKREDFFNYEMNNTNHTIFFGTTTDNF